MGYEHFNTTLVTELDEVAESSIKNLIPIPREREVTSDNESESNEPVKDDSSVFTTFLNLLFNDKDDVTIHEDDVPIEESKVHSNPLFDNDEINSDELESHVESNSVESLSNHDHLEEFSGPLIPIHIAEEERIRREHAEYISRMEMLFTINPRPRPMMNANTNVKSFPSSIILIQDIDSQREEIDIVTSTDDVLPPSFENDDDSEGEVDVVEELHVDNSISNSENELSDNEESDFNNPSFPRPPPEPPDAKFDFKPDSEEEISVVINTIDELECLDPNDEFDVSTNDENDDYFPFMFVIRIFLQYLICSKMSLSFLSAESEDTIFDPGKDYAQNVKNQSKTRQYQTQDWKSTAKAKSTDGIPFCISPLRWTAKIRGQEGSGIEFWVLPPLVQKPKPPSQRNFVVHQRDPLHPNIPYPSRMHKQKQQEKDEVQIHKFWKMFKKLHINITLADALILILKYQKMLKALISNKEKLLELANTPLNENCSAVILKKLPEKLGDPGKFLIPCGFSELKCKSLANLDASINLMPLSVWKKLGLPELISTRMTLELANRAIYTPVGIARDIFVPVGKFTFPADFVIVDYERYPRVPLILGRPFLRIARTLIDVHREEMILRDGDERLTLNMRHDT
nr:reverse transcriptase domain-containing protein [Tanacetum cinerariifolium]